VNEGKKKQAIIYRKSLKEEKEKQEIIYRKRFEGGG
jgi:hypothetical protein